MRAYWILLGQLLLMTHDASAQELPPVNYDESKVPAYRLPDLLVCQDGTRVRTPEDWFKKRRPEILELFRREMYGRAPGRPPRMRFELIERSDRALNGKAIRKQVRLVYDTQHPDRYMEILIYLPAASERPVPVFVGLNFRGNHSIHPDPAIRITTSWMRPARDGTVQDNRATEKGRGVARSRWPVEFILQRGYGLVTAYYGDIDPDFHDGFRNGVHGIFGPSGEHRPPDAWGSISAWAWGLSRIVDYLETDRQVDATRIAVIGHSRLGKTALWAGAQDVRFALVISNNSGCGGAALSRRRFGETVARINRAFPHWFCTNFKKYDENEEQLPIDQHMLIALIAPRPVYVASAAEDLWADPRGEFLSLRHADPVWRLLGHEGLLMRSWPPLDTPVLGDLGYHVRSGKHDVTLYDWSQYLDFADKHLQPRVAPARDDRRQ